MAERRRWPVLVASVIGVAVTVSLGVWQLDRAAQKRAMQQDIDQRAELPPLSTAELPAADRSLPQALVHRVARLEGRWDAAHTVYLDNRPMDGRVGFFVLTPLKLKGRDDAVLVQRGWVPRHAAQREALPPIVTAPGDVRIEGRLALSPSRAYELGQGVGSGPIRQNVDLSAFQGESGLRLLPLVLLQTEPAHEPGAAARAAMSDGLLRHWPPPTVDLHKHYGYAFQWFALAALILGLYVWFQVLAPLRRDRRRRDARDADAT
ncbi:SURF1 family protein [Roseateles amylovorans]|uniref:SURF1-like protein n=1 Tax=Roseateles amylovorans TaxID=2978473 RepID=A0ABY6B2C6_9BURK|nr:SURF1 family protein [Roseateles amylovorans]UXH77673.1 SURF1 family protein [Roseateles amylovorans]